MKIADGILTREVLFAAALMLADCVDVAEFKDAVPADLLHVSFRKEDYLEVTGIEGSFLLRDELFTRPALGSLDISGGHLTNIYPPVDATGYVEVRVRDLLLGCWILNDRIYLGVALAL